MGYGPIQIRKSLPSPPISHLLAGNWSRVSRWTDLSGALHFIAWFSDFANMRARFFDSIPWQGFTPRCARPRVKTRYGSTALGSKADKVGLPRKVRRRRKAVVLDR